MCFSLCLLKLLNNSGATWISLQGPTLNMSLGFTPIKVKLGKNKKKQIKKKPLALLVIPFHTHSTENRAKTLSTNTWSGANKTSTGRKQSTCSSVFLWKGRSETIGCIFPHIYLNFQDVASFQLIGWEGNTTSCSQPPIRRQSLRNRCSEWSESTEKVPK